MALVPFLLITVSISWSLAHGNLYEITAGFTGYDCTSNSIYAVKAKANGGCSDDVAECIDDGSEFEGKTTTICSENYLTTMIESLGYKYIIQELYSGEDCSTFEYAVGFVVTSDCVGGTVFLEEDTYGFIYAFTNILTTSGSALLEIYTKNQTEALCDTSRVGSSRANNTQLKTHACLPISPVNEITQFYYLASPNGNQIGSYRWYTSNDPMSDSSGSGSDSSGTDSGLTTGAIIGIGCSFVVVTAILVFVVWKRCSKSRSKQHQTTTGDLNSLEAATRETRGLWNDEVIIAKRIPRDSVKVKKLISRGAFGEVYTGQLHCNQVAVKILPHATRSSLKHVNDFLAEAKMTATMDHPHVVTFLGVAWESLSDLCVVLEFMDGGDLRSLLCKYETSKHPVGFNHHKVSIAMHVCQALTYLHSLASPVIHRDLKSHNILLNKAMEAKLTDFGISRERLDQTMTANRGTCLWMAPEVMLGERYDVKADMFSFGVVLSELDVHTLPYSHEKKRILDSGGRALADPTLFQRVAAGTVRVEFSDQKSLITELACACVSVDPTTRPSAAEAMYRLQVAVGKDLA